MDWDVEDKRSWEVSLGWAEAILARLDVTTLVCPKCALRGETHHFEWDGPSDVDDLSVGRSCKCKNCGMGLCIVSENWGQQSVDAAERELHLMGGKPYPLP
jgi:hypothetical protein